MVVDEVTRAERVIAFITKFCVVPEGKLQGKPVKLAPFQQRFIREVYDNEVNTSHGILSMPRKNGKTGLIACLLLAHVVGPEAVQNSRIVSGARSREQAGEVFNYAAKMVRSNPALERICRIVDSSKKIIGLRVNVEYQAISAEGKTAHGKSPVLAILDEVGQVVGPKDDFIDAITTAQLAYDDPLLLTISTQAATDGDLLSIWIDDAKRSKDPSIVCHVYEAPKNCEVDDLAAIKKANPAFEFFMNQRKLIEDADKAKRMPSFESTYRNLHLNQRVSQNNPFISQSIWEANGAQPEPLDGQSVIIGLDLSARTDLTAAVVVFEQDGEHHVHPFFWLPEKNLRDRAKQDRVPYDVWAQQGLLKTCAGATVDYEVVIRDLLDELGDCHITAIPFDRWKIDIFKKELDTMGIDWPMVEHGQGYKDMSPALEALEAALLNGKVRHGMHPILTMCAANAIATKDPAGNRKLDKSKATGRIDGLVALAMTMKHIEVEEEMDIDQFLADPIGAF